MNIIAIYPGRFQPFGKHHFEAFKALEQKFGKGKTFIATSGVVNPPKSPFNFVEKEAIINMYGIGDRLKLVKNPYKAEEILSKYDPNTTAVVFMVGEKDMKGDPRFRTTDSSYFQPLKGNEKNLKGYRENGYLFVAPHVSLKVPGYNEMSGTEARKALGNTKVPRIQKAGVFNAIFGKEPQDNMKVANMIFDKLEDLNEAIFSKDWWSNTLNLTEDENPCWSGYKQVGMKKKGGKMVPNCVPVKEGYMNAKVQAKHNAKMEKLKKFLHNNIGREFVYNFDEYPKTVFGVSIADLQESVICEICNKSFRQITERHLKYKHNTTLNEYIEQFPAAKLLSDSLRKELRDNNSMKDIKNIQKIAETKLTRYGDKNYNNYEQGKQTKLERYGDVTYNNPKFGSDNPATRSDVRKLISKGVTESYVKNPALKNERSIIGKNFGFGNKKEFKQKMIDKGYWLSEDMKSDFSLYRESVRNITEINYQKFFKDIPNAQLRSKKMHLDHKYSIFEGFMHDINPEIIGHYKNLEIMSHSINESKSIKSSISLSNLVEEILNSKNTLDMGYQLLMCGGAGGHMHHPFDIEWVKTGKDLVKAFQMSINYLKKGPASVKIDGVNASIRLITVGNKKMFVMDRGSNKPLDVKGITKDELEARFGSGHGMVKIGGTVLDIFNDAIPTITPFLKQLGLWDNPNIMFNIEYVAGSTNVLSYNRNFLAIHGLLEISQVTPTKRSTREISYNKSVMQKLLNGLAPTAKEYGYEVLGSIPTTLDGEPNLASELSKRYTVDSGDKEDTKTLSQWLAKAQVPTGTVKLTSGKVVSALSKEVFNTILNGTPLPDFIANAVDYKAATDGFVIYLATMKLGDAVLAKLNSPLGPVSEHEGIVIRDKSISKDPFKITGKFILGGLASSFNK